MLKLLHSWILCIHTARHLSASADLSTKCLLTCHLVQLILSQHACHTILDKQTKLKLHLKDTFLTLTQHYIPLQSASPAGKEKELRDGWHFSKLTTVNNTHIHVPPTVEQYTPWQLPNIIYWCSTNRCLKYLSTQDSHCLIYVQSLYTWETRGTCQYSHPDFAFHTLRPVYM